MRDKLFFDDWKEFTLQKPDEVILNHLENIKNKTTLTGSLKYRNLKEVNKVFALFLTHNYGSIIYELCNFLKYLSHNNLPFYNIMVMESNDLLKKIKKINFINSQEISNKFTLKLESYNFDISYSRISNLIIIIEFLEEILGLEEILLLDKSVGNVRTQKELQEISNNISKKVYSYLKNLLPTSHLQSLSLAIGNFIIKKNKDVNHKIVSEDISDDFIFDFWVAFSLGEKDLLIKTFNLASDLCLSYKKSIELVEKYNFSSRYHIDEEYSLNMISKDTLNEFLEQITSSDEHMFSKSFNKLCVWQSDKINILKKKELSEIEVFSKYDDLSMKLPLTILRVCSFGNIQNKIIENQRRKKSDLNNFFHSYFDTSIYYDQRQIIQNIINNNSFICEILFYKLWSFESPKVIDIIRNYLNKGELILFENFINQNKKKLDFEPILDDIDLFRELTKKRMNYTPDEYREEKLANLNEEFKVFINSRKFQSDFKSFLNFISKSKKSTMSFRRSGFDFNLNSEENIKTMTEIYSTLSIIKEFLFKFINCLNLNVNDLKSKFNEDKILFFEHFKLLYSKEGV
ncbi:hypothetical protein N9D05_05750 [Alphaproteobacteria bacterium]|nr:hypothetical protein [Alphaproteobacteria bacterium]